MKCTYLGTENKATGIAVVDIETSDNGEIEAIGVETQPAPNLCVAPPKEYETTKKIEKHIAMVTLIIAQDIKPYKSRIRD